MICEGGCIETKITALTHTRCEKCGHWRKIDSRKMTVAHLSKKTELEYVRERRG